MPESLIPKENYIHRYAISYLHIGIFCEIPIFEDALNLVVSLMITIFTPVNKSYLCAPCCVHAVYIKFYKVKYIIVL